MHFLCGNSYQALSVPNKIDLPRLIPLRHRLAYLFCAFSTYCLLEKNRICFKSVAISQAHYPQLTITIIRKEALKM